MYIATRVMTIAILVYGAWLSYSGSLSYGDLVAFLLYLNILFRPIEKISAILEIYPKGMAGFKRFVELLDTEPDVQDRPGAIEAPPLKEIGRASCRERVEDAVEGQPEKT